jgi:hypothetical protein
MGAASVLAGLRDRGFAVSAEGDKLVVRPGSTLTAGLRVAICAHKAELLALLSAGKDRRPEPRDADLGEAEAVVRWELANAARLTAVDRQLGHDPGGFCAEHNRWLSYPEQSRGACSGCVPVDPEREPEYWAGHWRRFTEAR